MTWMLVDGNNWFARDWYATRHSPRPDLTKQFVNRLLIIKQQFDLDRAVVAWDSPNSFRKELCSTYKANREAKADDYFLALRNVQSEVPQHVDCVFADGFEADDILATLTQIAHHEGERVVLFSSDKDLHQLLRKESVTQVTDFQRASAGSYSLKSMTADLLLTKYGVKPTQWVDYRVIAGDTSDGIKGVEGLGPTVAKKILTHCASLDHWLRSPFSVPGLGDKTRVRLLNSHKSWPDLRRLLTLRTDVPIPASWFQSIHDGAA